jgi:hypothetical protein
MQRDKEIKEIMRIKFKNSKEDRDYKEEGKTTRGRDRESMFSIT